MNYKFVLQVTVLFVSPIIIILVRNAVATIQVNITNYSNNVCSHLYISITPVELHGLIYVNNFYVILLPIFFLYISFAVVLDELG